MKVHTPDYEITLVVEKKLERVKGSISQGLVNVWVYKLITWSYKQPLLACITSFPYVRI